MVLTLQEVKVVTGMNFFLIFLCFVTYVESHVSHIHWMTITSLQLTLILASVAKSAYPR
jgi:hypothetical protein